MSWQQAWTKRFYPRERGWRDGTEDFHALVASAVPAGGRILEIGAGVSNPGSRRLATLGTLVGIDIDPDVRTNDALAEAHVLEGDRYPFPDASFDLCVANFVLEHVERPAEHLAEVRRVLKPGGAYVARTPNRWGYVALVSALTPHWFHVLVANRLRRLPEDAHDPYPTFYRLNSRGAIRRHAARAGLDVETLRLIEKEPSYGMASRALFLLFMAWERVLNATPLLEGLRGTILAVLRRPGGPGPSPAAGRARA